MNKSTHTSFISVSRRLVKSFGLMMLCLTTATGQQFRGFGACIDVDMLTDRFLLFLSTTISVVVSTLASSATRRNSRMNVTSSCRKQWTLYRHTRLLQTIGVRPRRRKRSMCLSTTILKSTLVRILTLPFYHILPDSYVESLTC